MKKEKALKRISDFVIEKEVSITGFDGMGAVMSGLSGAMGAAAGFASHSPGGDAMGAFGLGAASSKKNLSGPWHFRSDLSELHREELTAFLKNEGMAEESISSFIQERESVIASGMTTGNMPDTKMRIYLPIILMAIGYIAIVIHIGTADLMIGIGLICIGIYLLINPKKRMMKRIWNTEVGFTRKPSLLQYRNRMAEYIEKWNRNEFADKSIARALEQFKELLCR